MGRSSVTESENEDKNVAIVVQMSCCFLFPNRLGHISKSRGCPISGP